MPTQSVLLPTREKKATLVDLLDRVLEKGLVIEADIIISVAGIPLIGVNLRAALAGMETMLKYGLMQEWDARTRQWEREHIRKREPALLPAEEILLRMYGSHWYSKGIYRAWRPGQLYLTDKRLFLFRAEPGEMLFEIRFEQMEALAVKRDTHFTGAERDMIYLVRRASTAPRLGSGHGSASCSDRLAYLYAERPGELVASIEERMQALGLPLGTDPALPPLDPEVDALLGPGEVTAEGKMWHQVSPSAIIGATWRPGWLYLTGERLFWWCTEGRKALFDIPLTEVTGAMIETMDLGGLIKERRVLCLSYRNSHGERTALFAGDNLAEWQAALGRFVEEMETCPQCGGPAPARQLLEEGCPACGWTGPRLKEKGLEAKPTAAK